MGVLDPAAKPFRTGTPVLATPTITDSPIAVIGMSRDRKTLIGATVAAPYQLHYSTNDGATWSAGLLATADTAPIRTAVETDQQGLIGGYDTSKFLTKLGGWANRTMAGGTMTITSLVSARASGITVHPVWSLVSRGQLVLACEYGAKTNSPLTNNARYAYLSKDEGNFVKILDLQVNTDGTPSLGITPVSGGYHVHAIDYDEWANRIWVTGGDNNAWVAYSDDAADINIATDISMTSGSAAITTASTTTSTFLASHVGMPIRHANFPAGATIVSVLANGQGATLSAAATATATNAVVNWGPITWTLFHYGLSGRFQVVGIIPAPEGVYFGADGYPTGIHFSRRGVANGKPGKMRQMLDTAAFYKTGTGQHLMMGAFRAGDVPDAPILISGTSNDTAQGGYLALVHPSGRIAWKLWDDPLAASFSSLQQVWHTAAGNIIGTIASTRTTSGWQMFKAPMPKLPSASEL